MKKANLKLFGLIFLGVFTILLSSCNNDDEPSLTASVSVNETGSDIGGDVTGNGGSTTQVITWNNSLRTVDWNMDITSSTAGSFNLSINDAEGNNVLNETLVRGQGDDSRSGVSSAGTAGDWTITITLTDFNGDGSFSISPGN